MIGVKKFSTFFGWSWRADKKRQALLICYCNCAAMAGPQSVANRAPDNNEWKSLGFRVPPDGNVT